MTLELTIIRNANVYAPNPIGHQDIVVAAGKILSLTEPGKIPFGLAAKEIDAEGRIACPGFVDNHVHLLGGGGGLGFSSRAPELMASQLARAGITSVVGMLGFDSTTKSMAQLVGRVKALREDGISAYCTTGSTPEHPIPTLTGHIRTDIAFVEEIIGVGEISISELGYGYDSFGEGAQYIAKCATAALLAGRLARKSGHICLQVPPYRDEVLKPMFEVVDRTGIPISQFIPSHVNQTDEYMSDAKKWAKKGGYIDIGANYSPENNYSRATLPHKAFTAFIEEGISPDLITMSSDGNGAPPKEEKGEGKPRVANYMPVSSLHRTWQRIVKEEGASIENALKIVTTTPAQACGLSTKGKIAAGFCADILLLDEELNISSVMARGVVHVEGGSLKKRGMFDETVMKELA